MMNIPVSINRLSPDDRAEIEVLAMLHVVPEQIRKGSYQSSIAWKETVREALKALSMSAGAKRTAAIGRAHIALTAMGGVIRENT